MTSPLTFRWLGVAGIELAAAGRTLLIDPYLTRIPFWRQWIGGVEPDRALIRQHIARCDDLLISHAHFDPLLDAPAVMELTGATAYGSPNSCALLQICGAPPAKIREIGANDRLSLPPFAIEVTEATHLRLPGFGPGALRPGLRPPLRAIDYRMDKYLGFLIEIPGCRLMVAPSENPAHARPADILLTGVFRGVDYYERLLAMVKPKVVIPIHWENFWRPLSRPLQPMWAPPRLAFPSLTRINLARFRATIQRLAPQTRVFFPEIFRSYDMDRVATQT